MRRFSLMLVAAFAGIGYAAPLPDAPPDGIRDNAHAFEESTHGRLAAEVRAFRGQAAIDFWVCAVTFPPDSLPLRQYAQQLRQHWSPNQDAIVLAYDRVSDSQSLSFSPSLWDRYPSSHLILLMQDGARILADKQLPIEQRLEQSAQLTMTRIRELESERLQMESSLSAADRSLATTALILLAGGAALFFYCGSAARRRESDHAWQLLFPDVQVATRFGAPRGGGVIVQRR